MNVAFAITCKDRTQHLKLTLPQNLADNLKSRFVVLDYNSGDDLLEYLGTEHSADIAAGRLAVYSYRDWPVFRMSHAKNMAHRCGILEGGDILVNLDADNLTGPGFEDFITREFAAAEARNGHAIFLWANMIKGVLTRGVSGRIVISAGAFHRAGGYDEKCDHWWSDDKDMNLRLRLLGYHPVEIPPSYLNCIAHNNKIRFKDYPEAYNYDDSAFYINQAQAGKKTAVANGGSYGCGIVYKNFDFNSPIELARVPTRVFGIGMHKTATTSLAHAFQFLGYDAWHWSSAHAAKAIWREMNTFGFSRTVEQHHALCDLPIPMLYEKLDAAYPGSKFILTMRDEGKWLASCRRHFDPEHNQWRAGWNQDPFTNRVHKLLYGIQDFDPDIFLARYRRHNEEVKEYFRERPADLLIMDMDNHMGWTELCSFLGCEVPVTVPYPFINGSL